MSVVQAAKRLMHVSFCIQSNILVIEGEASQIRIGPWIKLHRYTIAFDHMLLWQRGNDFQEITSMMSILFCERKCCMDFPKL